MSELSESDAMSEGGSWGSSSVLEPVSSDFDGVSFLLTFRFLLALWISRTIGCPRMGEGSRAKADKMSICLYQRQRCEERRKKKEKKERRKKEKRKKRKRGEGEDTVCAHV